MVRRTLSGESSAGPALYAKILRLTPSSTVTSRPLNAHLLALGDPKRAAEMLAEAEREQITA